jgi:hypothetical protein
VILIPSPASFSRNHGIVGRISRGVSQGLLVNVTKVARTAAQREREREREEFGSSLRRKKSRLSLLQYLPISPPSLL